MYLFVLQSLYVNSGWFVIWPESVTCHACVIQPLKACLNEDTRYLLRFYWPSSNLFYIVYCICLFVLGYLYVNAGWSMIWSESDHPQTYFKLFIVFVCLFVCFGSLYVNAFNHECTFVSWPFPFITFWLICCCTHPKVITGNGQLTKVQSGLNDFLKNAYFILQRAFLLLYD